jgi:hypothetical protein
MGRNVIVLSRRPKGHSPPPNGENRLICFVFFCAEFCQQKTKNVISRLPGRHVIISQHEDVCGKAIWFLFLQRRGVWLPNSRTNPHLEGLDFLSESVGCHTPKEPLLLCVVEPGTRFLWSLT